MLRNKEDVKNIAKTLVILTTVVMTGCGSATPQTSENTSVNTDAVQAEKLTPEKSKSVPKKDSVSSSDESATKDNSKTSDKKNEDSKNEDKENTSDNKQSVDNKAKGIDSTQPQSASKQADPAPSTPSASSSSATKSQTCKTIHHDAQYETILHPAETHNEQVEHPATGHFEDVPITKEVGYIVCGCGEMFTSAEEYGKHSDPLVLSGDYIHGSYYTTSKTETVGYEKKWVQDTPAYVTTETIVDKEQWTENKLVKAAYDESVCQ